MKKRLQGIIIGITICMLLSNLGVVAKNGSQTFKAWYSDIKLCVNGEYVTPKDASGNVVEPFIINGTTYLPVRAVGNALGMDVDWDNNTKTVFIGKKPASTNSSQTVANYVQSALNDPNFKETVKSFEEQGIYINLYASGNSIVYDYTVNVSLNPDQIYELSFYFEENLSGLGELATKIKTECPMVESVIVKVKDADGTLIYSNEYK